MTKGIKLEAISRTKENGKPNKIRSQNFIPAVLYGPSTESRNLKIKKIDFEKIFAQAGESSLIDLTISGEAPAKVLIKEVQKDPIKDAIIHVDLYQVDMNKEITTEIPLHFIGESEAVKELGAVLVKNIDSVEVECLPGDLVNHIDVDLSVLKNFHDAIKTNDLNLPAGMKLVNETNDIVVNVIEPKVEVEEAPAEEVPVEGEEGQAGGKEGEGEKEETEAPEKENKKKE
ncbi:MAG: 50S ribosomal protein L25 [Patescibacteria group bacterium]|nr:50S ribosomal protein L25 [Patescibacteria group bacterium]MDD5554861.1 50S ribosomal protein L25 [Patescibacteria group bacterium]